MKLYIDEKLSDFPVEAQSMHEILHNNVGKLISPGLVVKDIFVNGKSYGSFLMDAEKSKAFKVSEGDEIKITTMDQKELVIGSIDAAAAFMKELDKGITRATDEIKWGNAVSGFNNFAGYLKGIAGFVQIMEKLSEFLKIDYNNYIFNGKDVQSYFGDLEKILSSILATQLEQDFVLLADVTEFELKPNIEIWIGILGDMKSKLEGFGK